MTGYKMLEIKDNRVKQAEKVDVDSIDIEDGRRPVHPDSVDLIASSMLRIGLRTPISIRYFDNRPSKDGTPDSYILISGAHRLAAAKQLGWVSIECFVLNDEPDDQAKLWEIAENLHRAELTAVERSELIAEWVRLSNKLAQFAPVSGGGRGNEGGIRKATRDLSIERTDAQRATKIASLTPEAKKVAVEVGLDNNKSALLAAKDKSGDAAKEVANLRAERARRDAEKQHKDAHRAKGADVANDHLATRLIWNIRAARYHLEDAVQEAKKLKPKLSERGMFEVGNAFMDVYELAFSGATIVKLKESPTK